MRVREFLEGPTRREKRWWCMISRDMSEKRAVNGWTRNTQRWTDFSDGSVPNDNAWIRMYQL